MNEKDLSKSNKKYNFLQLCITSVGAFILAIILTLSIQGCSNGKQPTVDYTGLDYIGNTWYTYYDIVNTNDFDVVVVTKDGYFGTKYYSFVVKQISRLSIYTTSSYTPVIEKWYRI